MERREEQASLSHEHRLAVELSEHIDVCTRVADSRRPDEHPVHRSFLPRELDVGLEAPHLAAVRIAIDHEIGQPEMLAVEHDHPRAGAEDRFPVLADRFIEAIDPRQAHDRGRLAAGDHETVEAVELLREPYFDDFRAE
jgi:hypothetical protein